MSTRELDHPIEHRQTPGNSADKDCLDECDGERIATSAGHRSGGRGMKPSSMGKNGIAKLFRNGRSQAVRLPQEGAHVTARRNDSRLL